MLRDGWLLVLLTTFILGASDIHVSAFQDEASGYRVGVAKRDVTPDYPVRLNGFAARKAPSTGVSQPIWARAMAIRANNDAPVVIVTLDNLGIRSQMVDQVSKQVNEVIALERDRLIVTFTHTHSAPKVNGASDNIFAEAIPAEDQRQIDRYTDDLTVALAEVVIAALKDLQPATLAWGIGQVEFAMNRRTAGGPTDHGLPVLVVRTTGDESRLRAIYTSYACHCVTLSDTKISGDWAGYAVESIERHFPDAIGMISIGCGSDQNPSSGVTGDKSDIAKHQGMQIGDEVARLIQNDLLDTIEGSIKLRSGNLQLAFEALPSREEYQQMRDSGGAAGYNAATQLAKLDAGEELPAALDYPMQSLSFGDDLCMVFLAGEVCVDYALRARRELNGAKLWMHGYSHDFGAYIPSERLLREGGYGAGAEIPYFALPTKLKAGLEQQIHDEIHRLVPEAFNLPPGTDGVPPQSPTASLRMMDTHDDLQVELVASEPQVSDPVAIDFGLEGELWVVQMSDYGNGVEDAFEQTGEVRRLRDADGDGFFETSQVFVEGLRYPTDVKVWREGILVCDAPDILYFEDHDNDGKADERHVLYTGFATHNGQARVNSLRWGLDNWLYGSCGLFGGQISNAAGETFDLGERDFRIRPDTGELEPVTGRTQQGRDRDDFGHWFGCDNGTLIRHYVIDDRYVRRSPFIEPPASAVFVPQGDNAGTLYPASDLVLFKLSGTDGRATAACGLGIYRDNLLGNAYSGNSFTCEPVNQLIYRQVLEQADGVIWGHRAESETNRDFLTSRDKWFRPVQIRTGPDGALWIVDMYRYVIEHPIWIPEERKQQLNLFAGQKMGRIFRVAPKLGCRDVPHLKDRSNRELAALLGHPNGCVRDLAHQLLIWRKASDVQFVLENQARSGNAAEVRVQSLSCLSGLGQLSVPMCIAALQDPDPQVRRHTLELAEPLFVASMELCQAALDLSGDDSFEVRLQLAYAIGAMGQVECDETWKELYDSDTNEYLHFALLSSLNADNIRAVTKRLLAEDSSRHEISAGFLQVAAELVKEEEINSLLGGVLHQSDEPFSWRATRIITMLDVLDRRSFERIELNEKLGEGARRLRERALQELESSRELSEDTEAALMLLGRPWGRTTRQLLSEDSALHHQRIAGLVSPLNPVGLQQAAIQALVRRGDTRSADFLRDSLPQATPTIRRAIVGAFLQQPKWDDTLVEALGQSVLRVGDFDAAQRQQLLSRLTDSLRSSVADVFNATDGDSRSEVLKRYEQAMAIRGNADIGRQVFRKSCATCHRLEDVGTIVGPDLAALTTLTSRSLLTAILDPNRDVDGRYQSYVVVTDEGLSYAGVLAEETSTSINILDQQGKSHSLLRQRIETLQSTGKSAMPEGLEQDINPSDMANLLAYLQQVGPAPKQFVGNQPRIIEPDATGVMTLDADAAAIFGDQIAFESNSPFRNIGYWHSGSDQAAWRVAVGKAGTYEVWLDYSCADATAGNEFWLQGGAEPLKFQVLGTGGWDKYRKVRLGTVQLEPGQTRFVAQGQEPLQGSALLDLRAIVLEPK